MKKYYSREDFNNFLIRLKESKHEINELPKSSYNVLVCGDTGAGKSTFINYLSGKTKLFSIKKDNYNSLVIECEKPIAKIGHEKVSTTSFPGRYVFDNICYWDCPGFEDAGGYLNSIVNAYTIAQLGNKGKYFKILAIIEETSLFCTRANPFRDLVIKVRDMFKNIDSLENSVLFCFTKSDEATEHKKMLLEMLEQCSIPKGIAFEKQHKEFLEAIVKNDQIAVFHEPKEIGEISSSYREQIVSKLSSCKFLNNQQIMPVLSVGAVSVFDDKLMKSFLHEKVEKDIKLLTNKFCEDIKLFSQDTLKDFAFNNFVSIYRKYENQKADLKDSQAIYLLSKLSMSTQDSDLLYEFTNLNFIITEVFEFLSEKILGQGKIKKGLIHTFFDSIASNIKDCFIQLKMYDEQKKFDNILLGKELEDIKLNDIKLNEPKQEVVIKSETKKTSCHCSIFSMTKVIYDNPILNHSDILKALANSLSMNPLKIVSIVENFDKDFVEQVCLLGNVELLGDFINM